MEPEEFERLERLAAQQTTAVAELIRQAVAERFFGSDSHRLSAATRVNSMRYSWIQAGKNAADMAEDAASRLTLGRTEGLR